MKRKLNWVDIVIVGIIVGLIYVGYQYLIKPNQTLVDKVEAEVIYRVESVLIETANGIKVGDVFKDKDTNQIIGEVIDKKITESYDFVNTGDGRRVKSKKPNKYDVYLTIKGDAIVTEDYIRMGGRDMRIEDTVFLKNNISSVESKVIDIKILK
ncbi:MAG: DUF4330 domain-containing protein [Tissierellales bacterium]